MYILYLEWARIVNLLNIYQLIIDCKSDKFSVLSFFLFHFSYCCSFKIPKISMNCWIIQNTITMLVAFRFHLFIIWLCWFVYFYRFLSPIQYFPSFGYYANPNDWHWIYVIKISFWSDIVITVVMRRGKTRSPNL